MTLAIVKKSHHMVTAQFLITAREQDILTLIFKELKRSADSVKYGKDLELKTEFQFTTKDLIDYFGIGRDTAYELMATLAKGMVGKQAIVKQIALKNVPPKVKVLTLCSYGEYDSGQLTLRIDRATAHYMLDYSKGFAEIDFKLSLSLTKRLPNRWPFLYLHSASYRVTYCLLLFPLLIKSSVKRGCPNMGIFIDN